MKRALINAVIMVCSLAIAAWSIEAGCWWLRVATGDRVLPSSVAGLPELPRKARECPQENGKSHYYNREGKFLFPRPTTDQPAHASRTVWMFGGSTMWGMGSTDRYTIPSCLQRLLPRYIVHNRAMVGDSLHDQLNRLKNTSLSKGDIVVFYVGVNEIGRATSSGQLTRKKPVSEKLLSYIHTRFYSKSDFVKIFIRPAKPVVAEITEAMLRQGIESASKQYRADLDESIRVVKARGATLFLFLQPTVFSGNTTLYERQIFFRELPAQYSARRKCIAIYYPMLDKINRESRCRYANLSRVLDRRPANTEYFYDGCHPNFEANEIIAGAIENNLRNCLHSEAVGLY